MKRIFALILVVILCLAFAGCNEAGGSTNASGESTTPSTENRDEKIPVGEVTVTAENWTEFFEIVNFSEIESNNFGDVEQVRAGRLVVMKEAYAKYCSASTVAIEIKETNPYLACISMKKDGNRYEEIKRYTDAEIVEIHKVAEAKDYFENHETSTTSDDYIVYKNIVEGGLSFRSTVVRINGDWTVSEDAVTMDLIQYDTYELVRVVGALTFSEEPLTKINLF